MTKVAPIDQRKADHIKINLEQDVRSALTTGLENYQFIHEALPELDLNASTQASACSAKNCIRQS